MAAFLCFRLHGPLASWGDIAVGDRRPSAPHPSRSAVLGLVAASLGVRREDGDAWAELERGLGFASWTAAPGALLVDYHTAQGPDETLLRRQAREAKKAGLAWHRPATRRAELGFPRAELSTMLSSRQYRMDAVWSVALWARPGLPERFGLAVVAEALRRPHFVLYLGRKSCPLDVPLEAQLVEAADPGAALTGARFSTDAVLAPVLGGKEGVQTLQWEDSWPGLVSVQTVRRRDRVVSRARWQFTEREEHQGACGPARGGDHVPEQG